MRRNPFLVTCALLAFVSVGCAKKNADMEPAPALDPVPEPEPTVSAPIAAPTPAPAPEPDPFDGDLESVNRYVRERGLLRDVLFDYDRHELRDDARRQLEANARFLAERPQFRVALEGHADERGTLEYNITLGQQRASSARSFLDTLGVSTARLDATSYGEERPLCTETTEDCWQRNRRVHFVIVGRVE